MIEDLRTYLEFAKDLAKGAGEIQLRHFRHNGLQLTTKYNNADIVTIADKESEKLILNSISERYPSHSILSEESGTIDGEAEWKWIIDPLDGTTNFSQGLPVFSISIALQHYGETVVGVVYAPYLNEMFTAIKGQGAWLNSEYKLRCKNKSSIEEMVIDTGIPVDKDKNPDNNLDNISRVVKNARGLRIFGSAALDLCYVAAGFIDAYWEMNIHPWDVAAGELIASEAGAVVGRYRENRGIATLTAGENAYKILIDLIR